MLVKRKPAKYTQPYSINIEDGAITAPQSCLSGGIPFIRWGEGEAAIPNVT